MMSNVCRFFLNNSCRYGSKCRYSHNVSDRSSTSAVNPYVYIRDQNKSPQNWNRNLSNREVREIIDKISEEAKHVEYENMWPLTSLSVLRDAPNVPGWEDYSMEEIRAAAYSSKAAGRFDEYLKFFVSLQQKAKENRLIFLNPGKKAEEIVRSIYDKHSHSPAESSTSNFGFNANEIPAFGGGSSSASAAPFSSSGFGSQPSNTIMTGSSPFGAVAPFSSADPGAGIFAMAARGFNQSSFSQSMSSNSNETAMETATDISLNQNAASPFHHNVFAQVSQPSGESFMGGCGPPAFVANAAPSGFDPFGASTAGRSPAVAHLCAVFTPMGQLTEMELEQFKATTFTLDKLPLRPPPRELC